MLKRILLLLGALIAPTSLLEAQTDSKCEASRLIKVRYYEADALVTPILEAVGDGVKVQKVQNEHSLLFTGECSQVTQAVTVVEALDVKPAVVGLSTEVFAFRVSDLAALGYEMDVDQIGDESATALVRLTSARSGGFKLSFRMTKGQKATWNSLLDEAIREGGIPYTRFAEAMLRAGLARHIGTPVTSVASEHTATIQVGDAFNVFAEAADSTVTFHSGITIAFAPRVTKEQTIALQSKLSVSVVERSKSDSHPVKQRYQTIQFSSVLNPGEALITSGVELEERVPAVRGVPVLKDIPLVGRLFRRTGVALVRDRYIARITPRIESL